MDLGARFCEALIYAVRLHGSQRRRISQAPYVAHLLRVAGIVLENGGDEDEAVAALLHDAVEDQGGRRTAGVIRQRFGARVADIVEGCSDCSQYPKPPWAERKQSHLAKLRHADASVLLVVAADKLDNARSLLAEAGRLGQQVWERFAGGRDGTMWYFRQMVEITRGLVPQQLASQLEQAVDQLQQLSDRPGNISRADQDGQRTDCTGSEAPGG